MVDLDLARAIAKELDIWYGVTQPLGLTPRAAKIVTALISEVESLQARLVTAESVVEAAEEWLAADREKIISARARPFKDRQEIAEIFRRVLNAWDQLEHRIIDYRRAQPAAGEGEPA